MWMGLALYKPLNPMRDWNEKWLGVFQVNVHDVHHSDAHVNPAKLLVWME